MPATAGGDEDGSPVGEPAAIDRSPAPRTAVTGRWDRDFPGVGEGR